MKKVKISLTALVLVVAIAGTTTVNATRKNNEFPPCSVIDPDSTLCDNSSIVECCEEDGGGIRNQRAKPH